MVDIQHGGGDIKEKNRIFDTRFIIPSYRTHGKEDAPEQEKPVIELTSEEKQMKMVKSFYEVEPYIKGLKSEGKLNKFGKYATMPENEDCHLFVYDKQGNISALLRKSGDKQFNLNTLKEDNVKNYKNCGAIWFQLK